jgi:ribonuclease P protein component
MFPRSERLGSAENIRFVYKKGRRIDTQYFTIWALKKKEGPLRSAVVCSRKFDKHATARNRAKRRISHALKVALDGKKRLDIVVNIKRESTTASPEKLRKTIKDVFNIL